MERTWPDGCGLVDLLVFDRKIDRDVCVCVCLRFGGMETLGFVPPKRFNGPLPRFVQGAPLVLRLAGVPRQFWVDWRPLGGPAELRGVWQGAARVALRPKRSARFRVQRVGCLARLGGRI